MTDPRVLDLLNDVLAAMEKCPHARLAETGVFLSSVGTEEYDALCRILEDERRQTLELADLLIELGGVPASAAPDFHTARLHYLDLHFLLGEVLHAEAQLLAGCESALEPLAGTNCTPAYQLVSGIVAAHREHIALLRRFTAQTSACA
ncbi:MAG: hypothetical protein V2A79_02275 [Planctomycetota bacterium]